MPLYAYEAADRAGKKLSATMEAPDELTVRDRLKDMGLIPLAIKPVAERGKAYSFSKITTKDLLTFTEELANLLEAGLPLDRAVFVLSNHAEKEVLRNVLGEVYKDIQRGQSLSQAFTRHPQVFPRIYVNMVRAGEVGGILDSVLKRLASFLETSVSFQEELTSALVYPIVLTVVGFMAVMIILLFVVPRFSVMFEDMGQALPLPTLILLHISQIIKAWWWALVGALAGVVLLVRAYFQTSEGRVLMDTIKLNIPLLSSLHMKSLIARFSRTLGTLLQSGVPILEAIMVSREVVGNSIVSKRLESIEDGVRKGRGISVPLKECGVFPSIVVQMISVGEEAGRLDQTFISVAERFEGESRSLIKRIMSLIAPLLILVMAGIVAFIVFALLLAIFSINDIPM